ncbi:TIGR02588 family protein [Geodermatophilus sp. DF01-2]|uniref:TIGR02588 family protein n=1 Tax=Geodermatophilus sp. DF01-2 TaxID=2559610 RepID=UPI001073EA70|nr:TIGR02588 family protein [Geodermatophilus sp. DF01_2]TFV59575.1 TIGR02588 family protein [Geodermatophilus sp. DF01_2]
MRTTSGEYLLGVVGGVLVVAVLAFLLYDALAARQGGPRLSVEVTAVTPAPEGFSVGYELRNEGGETAEQVEVSAELTRAGSPVEQAGATADYVAPGSRRQGALLFTEDPRSGELQVTVSGYVLP